HGVRRPAGRLPSFLDRTRSGSRLRGSVRAGAPTRSRGHLLGLQGHDELDRASGATPHSGRFTSRRTCNGHLSPLIHRLGPREKTEMMNQMDIEDRWHEPETSHMPLHGPEAFEGMRRAGRLAAETLDHVTPHVRPGVTTGELDRICHEFIVSHGAVPAPLNYRGFPKSICTSINHVVCHGIPGERRLDEGDILNIDVTVILDGWYGDTSRMFPVGKIGVRAQRLIDVTYEALMLGIEEVRPGASLADIGYVIQTFAERHGFSVVEDFCGHGLGRVFHAPPSVLHYVRSRKSDSRRKRHPEIRYTKGQE